MIVTLMVVLVLTFFFLKDGHHFRPWLREATGRRTGWHLTELLTRERNANKREADADEDGIY